MLSIAIKSVWAHKRRLVATTFSVVLGVAFLAGTLLLGDTLRANFDKLFTQANGTTDVVVRSATALGSGPGSSRTSVDASLLPAVRNVPGVADAAGYIQGFGKLVDHHGKAIGGNGPPTTAANWISDPRLNAYRLVQGHAPRTDDQVVINRGAAKTGHLAVGDTTTLLTPAPRRVHIVGIATFGTADGFGSGTFTGMTLHAAQTELTRDPTQLTQIMVSAAPGVSASELAGRVQTVLPRTAQAITGKELAAENFSDINSGFLGFMRTGLVVFAVIALLVAAFSIYNTFSILAAQRSRESALLRALGASRRQVLGTSIAETATVGLVGSLIGWAGGIGIAALLKGVFDGFGFALPAGGLVFRPASAVIAIVSGLVVTVLAGVLPAVRASRVAPLAALRDTAAEAPTISGRRIAAGAALTAAGAATTFAAVGVGQAGLTGLGAVLLIAGMVVLGPVAARAATSLLGAPVAALRGITGSLARQNAGRNPRRTAATASALMVGVTVVALFTVVGSSLKASAAHGVNRTLRADLVVDIGGYGGASGNSGLSPQLGAALARLPEVRTAAPTARGTVLLAGHAHTVSIGDGAQLVQVLDFGSTSGSVAGLGASSLAVSRTKADDNHWRVGTLVPVTYPDGATGRLRLAAIYDHADMTGDYLLSRADWVSHAKQALDAQILLELRPGADVHRTKAAVKAVAASYGKPRVQDLAEYRASVTNGVNTILGLVYVMLALAIIIALMGIANTLTLSIHERTRELGLLRAVGQSRRQTRAMIRWESVLIAIFGTVGGALLGLFLGWALVTASSTSALEVFSAPPVQLAIFLVVGAIAGVLAGIRPARRAARQGILTALAAD
jgi:putative ABC transport system permease protein